MNSAGDLPVFNRLAHHFQCRSFELRQFIEKEDAIVRQTYFARIWECATAEQANVADGVMWRSKWSYRNERPLTVEQTGNTMNFGGFNGFFERKGWNDCGDAF